MGLLIYPPPAILFRFLGSHWHGLVLAVQGLPGDKHVTAGALWLGEITLLQYHYSFPHVAVKEVDLEGCLN